MLERGHTREEEEEGRERKQWMAGMPVGGLSIGSSYGAIPVDRSRSRQPFLRYSEPRGGSGGMMMMMMDTRVDGTEDLPSTHAFADPFCNALLIYYTLFCPNRAAPCQYHMKPRPLICCLREIAILFHR